MRHLFSHLERVRKEMEGLPLYLFTDYDGTLAPLAPRPGKAGLPPETKKTLSALSRLANVRLAVVSGRMLEDIEEKVGIRGIVYSGNHGLEIAGPGIRFGRLVSPRTGEALRRICRGLSEKLAAYPGAFIEDKVVTVSLHFRMATPRDVPRVLRAFRRVVSPYVGKGLVRVRPAKMVREVRPPVDWNKGSAVRWLLKKLPPAQRDAYPLYLGDDVADEDVFKALKKRGLTVLVGKPRPSHARYHLRDPHEVYLFLRELYRIARAGE